MTSRWSVAAAFSKSKGILRYFADFRGDSGSLALRAPRKVHHIYTREVVLCLQNCLKRAFRGKFIGGGGQMRAQDKKVNCIWAASTATAAANVTNTSFKSSTYSTPANNFIGFWTIGKSKQGNGGGFRQLVAEIRATLYICYTGWYVLFLRMFYEQLQQCIIWVFPVYWLHPFYFV